MSSGREVTAFWGPQDSILVLTELEMPISPAADNKLPFLLIWAAPRVSGMSPVPLPVPGGRREQPKPAARRPQNTRTTGDVNQEGDADQEGSSFPSHAPSRHRGGSGREC